MGREKKLIYLSLEAGTRFGYKVWKLKEYKQSLKNSETNTF